jgi:hypothetical protein
MKKIVSVISIFLLSIYSYEIIDDKDVKGGIKVKEKEEVVIPEKKKRKKRKAK